MNDAPSNLVGTLTLTVTVPVTAHIRDCWVSPDGQYADMSRGPHDKPAPIIDIDHSRFRVLINPNEIEVIHREHLADYVSCHAARGLNELANAIGDAVAAKIRSGVTP